MGRDLIFLSVPPGTFGGGLERLEKPWGEGSFRPAESARGSPAAGKARPDGGGGGRIMGVVDDADHDPGPQRAAPRDARKRPGRRPGGADTRGTVLAAARTEFAASGYEAASVRSIARAAGVDPALVHHYFGTKQGLFLAALDFPLDPRVLVGELVEGDRDTVGERVARFAFTLWEEPHARERLVATLRAVAGSDRIAQMMRGFVARELVAAAAERMPAGPGAEGGLGSADRRLRVELAASQIIGVAMARYVLMIEPLASAGVEELVALVAPTLQRYLGDG